jgi:hypothetical protein
MEVKTGWMLGDFGPHPVVFGFAGASIGACFSSWVWISDSAFVVLDGNLGVLGKKIGHFERVLVPVPVKQLNICGWASLRKQKFHGQNCHGWGKDNK